MSSSEASAGALRVLDVTALPGHYHRLYRAAYALCASREDAEDLVQERNHVRVLRRPRPLRREHDMAYLLRVLRNTWIKNHRARAARPQTTDLSQIELVADPHEHRALAALELDAVYGAMRELPPALRDTIVAVDLAGLSYQQAARALATKPGTIMSRLYRARERIANQLDRDRS